MKVALSGAYNTLDAGPSRVHEGLAHGLAEQGLDVLMLSHGDRDQHPHHSVTVECLGDRPSSVNDHRRIYRRAKEIADDRADIYHTLEDQPEESDVRTVQFVTTLPQALRHYPGQIDLREELGDIVLNVLARRGAKRAGYVAASSPETERQMRRWWRFAPDEVIPLGIPSETLSEPASPGETVQILVPGRVEPKKGQREVLSALDPGAESYDVDIVGSAGDDEYAEAVRDRWGEAYHGFVSRDRLEELYETADVVVVGSHHENFSMTALEGAARGCAVAITDGCGFAQLTEARESDGVVTAASPTDLGPVLNDLIRDSGLGDRKEAAYELARGLTWERIADRYIEVYENSLKQPRSIRQ